MIQRDCPKPIIVAGFRWLDFHPEVPGPRWFPPRLCLPFCCGKIELEMSAAKGTPPVRTKFQGFLPGGLNILKSCKHVSFFGCKTNGLDPKGKKRQNRDHQADAKGPWQKIWEKSNPNDAPTTCFKVFGFRFCNFDRPFFSPKTRPGSPTEVLPAWWPSNLSSCRPTIRESCWGESDNGGVMEDTTMAISMTKLMIQTNWISEKWW